MTAGPVVRHLLPAVFLLAIASGPVFAHAKLKTAAPAPHAKVKAGLKEIKLVFGEAIEPSLSSLELDDAQGKAVQTAKGATACKARTCAMAVPALAVGSYTVKYHVLSEDGHVVDDSYSFQVVE